MTRVSNTLTGFVADRLPPLYPEAREASSSSSRSHVEFDLVVGLQVTYGIMASVLEPLLAHVVDKLRDYLNEQPVPVEFEGIDAWIATLKPQFEALYDKIISEAPQNLVQIPVTFGREGEGSSGGGSKGKGKGVVATEDHAEGSSGSPTLSAGEDP